MSDLQVLCDDTFELSNSAVGMFRSFVVATHRDAGTITEMRDDWSSILNSLAKQLAETEAMWQLVRDCWSGGEDVIRPDAQKSVFDLMNSLLSNIEVVFLSVEKTLERSDGMLSSHDPRVADFCRWVVSHRADVESLRIRAADMRVDFDSVMMCIQHEAQERGITEQELFQEEMDSRTKLARINPSFQKWDEIASRSGAPEYMKDETDGPCPF